MRRYATADRVTRRKKSTGEDRAGAVLIAVLAITALAAAITLEIAALVRVDGERIRSERDRLQAELYARDGLLAARLLLAADRNGRDDLLEPWAQPLNLSRPGAKVAVRIRDTNRFFPIHTLVKPDGRLDIARRDQLERLFALLARPHNLADRIADFIDPDDAPLANGAERDRYFAQDPPTLPNNRPLYHLSELGRVLGMTDEIDSDLVARLTLFGSGSVNVNTAKPDVLAALAPSLTLADAGRIHSQARLHPFNAVEDVKPYTDLTDEEFAELAPYLSVSSDAYLVTATAKKGRAKVTLTAVLKRSPNGDLLLEREEIR
ncbi:MAG: general secretion pathway protein GspK [Candidatus Hydrogenedentota bacterium]|nr:MAG: general secretion pathway protein GspK [Candidatus Hydrogenedentota bacterium]